MSERIEPEEIQRQSIPHSRNAHEKSHGAFAMYSVSTAALVDSEIH